MKDMYINPAFITLIENDQSDTKKIRVHLVTKETVTISKSVIGQILARVEPMMVRCVEGGDGNAD